MRKNGGGVSGSWCKNLIKGIKGPTRTILMGERMVDTTYCQADWDAEPKKDCGDWSNKKAVPKIKANAKMRKQTTNLILGICILMNDSGF